MARSVARELGRKATLRAFMPSNLQWLCENCHRAKTTSDMARLRALQTHNTRTYKDRRPASPEAAQVSFEYKPRSRKQEGWSQVPMFDSHASQLQLFKGRGGEQAKTHK